MYNDQPWNTKPWLLCRGYFEKDQWSVRFKLVIDTSGWPLFRGGRCSEVIVKTGLAIFALITSSLRNCLINSDKTLILLYK
jgi:hypothetical protein